MRKMQTNTVTSNQPPASKQCKLSSGATTTIVNNRVEVTLPKLSTMFKKQLIW